jgi:hypothetical protein
MTLRSSHAVDPKEIQALRALVDADGIAGAERATELGKVTLMRVLAGLPVSAGTRAAIREAVRGGTPGAL